MDDDKDYILDIRGVEPKDADLSDYKEIEKDAPSLEKRPYVCVHFECCGVYARIYRNKKGTAYEGWCPKCCRKVRIKIGPNGVDTRFFRAF